MTYTTSNGEDMVTVDRETGTFRTYTRGCKEPLYVGTDAGRACESLKMNIDDFRDLLMSDPSDE